MSNVKLRTYVSMRSKIIKQEVKLYSVVCSYEGFKSMGAKVIKTQEMCRSWYPFSQILSHIDDA